MLKIVFKKCAGIDVHSTQITVCTAITDANDITLYEIKVFKTFTQDLKQCRDWLISKDITDVCMESTGKYWIPVYNILEEKLHCVITHPKYVRTILGKKTDKKDAKWIADMFKHGLVEPSFMPPKDIRELRDLMRYRNKLINIRSGEKNRFQNSLTVSNVQIANVLTDTFGKTSQSILKLMLENPNIQLEDIKPLIQKHIKATPDEIYKAIDGSFSESQSSKISVCLTHYEAINDCVDYLEQSILKLAIKYTDEINLLLTIPGIKEISAIFIIAEIGTDMNAFIDSNHLVSWVGLVPRCNESNNKKKSVRITKAGVYIKPLLVQCALCAIKDKSCPYFKMKYESLKRVRGHKIAIIAIARILLVTIYNMLKTGEVFDYERCDKLIERNFKPKKQVKNTPEEMISYLSSLGYTVTVSDAIVN